MTHTEHTAPALRKLAKVCGLKNVRIRKGTGCRAGTVHFFAAIDATREDRIAMVAFLRAIGAEVRQADYSRLDLDAFDPRNADSFSVVRWSR